MMMSAEKPEGMFKGAPSISFAIAQEPHKLQNWFTLDLFKRVSINLENSGAPRNNEATLLILL